MAQGHNDTKPPKKKCSGCGFGPFILGLIVALAFGWLVYPELMYSSNEQPISFSHKVHIDDAGMVCADCHFISDDGSFTGLPGTEDCASCHSSAMGEHPEELRFVAEYVETGREIRNEWKTYQKQPDNVYFSHTAHSLESCNQCHDYEEAELCASCHYDMSTNDIPPVQRENVLTGYTRQTMSMYTCESCHADDNHLGVTTASNACFVCHK